MRTIEFSVDIVYVRRVFVVEIGVTKKAEWDETARILGARGSYRGSVSAKDRAMSTSTFDHSIISIHVHNFSNKINGSQPTVFVTSQVHSRRLFIYAH